MNAQLKPTNIPIQAISQSQLRRADETTEPPPIPRPQHQLRQLPFSSAPTRSDRVTSRGPRIPTTNNQVTPPRRSRYVPFRLHAASAPSAPGYLAITRDPLLEPKWVTAAADGTANYTGCTF